MFNKFNILNALRTHSDILLELKNGDCFLCTAEFSNKYIRRNRKPKFIFKDKTILVFSWTDNMYRIVEPMSIKSWKPLSKILGNVA